MKNKVTANQKLAFVEKIIAADIFNSSEVAAVALLQQLVDSAKKESANSMVRSFARWFKDAQQQRFSTQCLGC